MTETTATFTIGGNRTFFELTEIARDHNLKGQVPPSIIVGFGSSTKPRLVWTCPKTGFIRVKVGEIDGI